MNRHVSLRNYRVDVNYFVMTGCSILFALPLGADGFTLSSICMTFFKILST